MYWCPSWLRLSGLALGSGLALDDAHDVGLLHDQEILAIELHLGAGPLAEQDAVAFLDVERDQLAGLVTGAWAGGDDFALHRLFLGRVGDDNAARGLLFGFKPTDHDPVVQRTELHSDRSLSDRQWDERIRQHFPRGPGIGTAMVSVSTPPWGVPAI